MARQPRMAQGRLLALMVLSSLLIGSNASTATGYLRYFGPVKAGCVLYDGTAAADLTATTAEGTITATTTAILTLQMPKTDTTCTDVFTGGNVPFYLVQATTAGQTTAFTVSPASKATLAKIDATARTDFGSEPIVDIFADLKVAATVANALKSEKVLAAEVKFSAAAAGIIALYKKYETTIAAACNTAAKQFDKLATVTAALGAAKDLATTAGVTDVLTAFGTGCSMTAGLQTNMLADANGIAGIVALATLANTVGKNSLPINDIPRMARIASYVGTMTYDNLITITTTNSATIVKDATIDVSAIATGLSITGYTAIDTSVVALGVGPYYATAMTYQPFHATTTTTLAATRFDGSVAVSSATLADYTIPKGAIDTILTTDPASPVTLPCPIVSKSVFSTNSTAKVTVSAVGSIVRSYYLAGGSDATKVQAVPTAANWKTAYDLITGKTLPTGIDYQIRNFTFWSATHLAVFASDVIAQSIPALAGPVIVAAKNSATVTIDAVAQDLFDRITAYTATKFSTAADVDTVVQAAYTKANSNTAATGDTALALTQVSTVIAQTNALLSEIITQATANITAGTTPSASSFTAVAQIAKFQYSTIATAINAVGSTLATGTAADAKTSATTTATNYAGTNLRSNVTAMKINQLAMNQYFSVVTTGNTGYARFLGPVASGCAVVTDPTIASLTTKTGGTLSNTGLYTTTVNTSCTDTFTGQKLPYSMVSRGPPSGAFQVNPSTTILGSTPWIFSTAAAYGQVSLTGITYSTDFDGGDIYATIKAGKLAAAQKVLTSDLVFASTSSVVTLAALKALSSDNTTATCKTSTDYQLAFAKWVALLATPFNPLNATQVGLGIASLKSACGLSDAQIAVANTDAVTSAAVTLATYAEKLATGKNALQDTANQAHLASYLSTLTYDAAIAIKASTLAAAVNAAPIVPDVIASTLGITGYSSLNVTATVQSTGTLTGAVVKYQPFYAVVPADLTATSATGTVAVVGASFGTYTVPAGSVDNLLTFDPKAPVTTKIPVSVVAPFTGATKKVVLSPVGGVVRASYNAKSGDTFVPSVPVVADWKAALDTLTATTLPAGDYHGRDFAADSATGLAVYVCDVVSAAVPALTSTFVNKAITTSKLEDVVDAAFKGMIKSSTVDLATTDVINTQLKKMYADFSAVNATSNSTTNATAATGRRRRLLQSDMDTILTSISTAIAATNGAANEVLDKAKEAITSGGSFDATLFVTATQIAAVQQSSLLDAISNVATLVAQGKLSAAAAAATAVQGNFTGDALKAAIAAAKVNSAALQALIPGLTLPPPPPPPSSDDDKKKKLAIGLGVGLGVGIPVVAILIVGLVLCIKSRRGQQSTSPAPAAESVERV